MDSAEIKKLKQDNEKLKQEVVSLGISLDTAIKEANKLMAYARETRSMVNDMYNLFDGKKLDKAKEDSESIHRLYRITFLKTCVATEVLHFYLNSNPTPEQAFKMALTLIACYDNDNDWWLSRETTKLGKWVEELTNYKG